MMFLAWVRYSTIVCAILLLSCCHLFAQADVTGVVLDPDGAGISNVKVALLRRHGMEEAAECDTDARGRFNINRVMPAEYELMVPASNGFELYKTHIRVADVPVKLRIQLALARIVQDVQVTGETNRVSLDAASNSDQVSADAEMMQKVPVFDQDYIAALAPFLDQAGVATSGVSIIVDGVEMKGTGVSASAIAEAHINDDPYSAETNRPGKGRIEIITKSGSAQLHGNLNLTLRDSAFDAKNYFAASKPFEQKRIYEGSITGPFSLYHQTGFLISGSRQEDRLQSIVHAEMPAGILTANVATPQFDTEFAVRLSHDFSSAHRVSLQYNVTDAISHNQGTGGLVLDAAGVNTQAREDDVIFNDRVVVSPALLNQLQLFFEKDYDPTLSALNAQKIAVDGAFTGGGAQADMLQTENNLKINDIVSWTHGRHYIKFGINIPNLSRRAWDDDSNRTGTFNFSSLADYETNAPYSFTQQSGAGRTVFWMNEIGAFFQDQIQLRPNLQASIGLRYDWQTYFKSIHDLAPRLSIAWTTADHKLVLRAGAGMFYDRTGAQPMADLTRYNGIILRSYTLLNPSFPDPYPVGTDPNRLPTNLVTLKPGGRLPYIANFSIGAERQLANGVTAAATYRGTLGVALFRSRDVNAPLPPLYMSAPNPAFGIVRQIESEGRQVGNALDLTLTDNRSRWFSGMAQYTFSHTDNNTGGVAWFPANQYTLDGEYGRADFDQRHRFNVLGAFNADHWLNLGVAAKLYSGTPYTETSGVDAFNTGMLNARPTAIRRNTLQTGGNANLDLRWSRGFQLHCKSADKFPLLSVAIDAFNVTNRTNPTSYVGNVQSAFFDQPTAALPARRLQFTARMKF
jgi:hypothetical protein